MFRSPKDVKVKEIETSSNKDGSEEYYCDLCEQGPWLNEIDVEIHRKASHKFYILKKLKDKSSSMCSICLRDQKNKRALIEHILEYHLCCSPHSKQLNREIYICDHCNHLFFNKQLLITHLYHWHNNKRFEIQPEKVNCPKCWKCIRGKSLWFHLLYHGAYNIGTCPICLRNCDNSTEMVKHLKTHPGHFLCAICGYETTKECYFAKHAEKHEKNVVCQPDTDVSKYFLPQKMHPSIRNRMNNIFKGIPLTNEVRICILCRALCVSNEEMVRHIYGAHAPEAKVERKTYKCVCGEEFFNSVLLKHHIFKLKGQGEHQAWDGESAVTQPVSSEEHVVYVFELDEPIQMDVNEIIIDGLQDQAEPSHSSENDFIISDINQLQQMDS